MKAWGQEDPARYRALPLHAHDLLEHVPLHDVWHVELPGGDAGLTLADLRALMSWDQMGNLNPVVRALFELRRALGRWFRWDENPRDASMPSWLDRVPQQLRERSLLPPGTSEGPFRLLYALESESVSEARNATVHAFSVMALEKVTGGYRAVWAIYVAPVSRWTAWYMALIDPFRHWIVYPAVLKRAHRAWVATWPDAAAGRRE